METTLFSIKEKRFVNRGFLNGPLCPVYGTGMVIILYLLRPFYSNVVLLFIMGAILASILEYITGYLLEKLFYTRWWDYSQKKYNLQGYVCLENTLDWGILCVIMINVVQPFINNILASINELVLYPFVSVAFTFLIIDAIVTVSNLLNLKQYISSLNIIHNRVHESEALKATYDKLHQRLSNRYININQYIKEIKEFRQEELGNIQKYLDRVDRKSLLPKRQLRRLFKNYKTINLKSKYKNEVDIVREDLK